MADDDLVQINLKIEMRDANPNELDVEVHRLHRELREASFTTIEARESAPLGTKSMDAITLGALTVALLPKLIPQLIRVLSGWLLNRATQTLKLKLPNGFECELTGSLSASEFKELTEQLLSKRTMAQASGKR